MDPKVKHRLIPTAVPIKYENRQNTSVRGSAAESPPWVVKTPRKRYERKRTIVTYSPSTSEAAIISPDTQRFLSAATSMSTPSFKRKLSFEETPRKKRLKAEVTKQRKLLSSKRSLISKLKKKKAIFKSSDLINAIDSFNFKSQSSKALVRMQFKTSKVPWSASERRLALSLYYKSPKAYKFLQQEGIILPALSTIRRWLGSSYFLPGFNNSLFQQIKKKFLNKTSTERSCSISFDEMSIMENLEYSKALDMVEGFEDKGHLAFC